MADGCPKLKQISGQANRPWTVMIFMIAEHVFEWADLSKEAQTTLDAIESVTLPSWLRICVPSVAYQHRCRALPQNGCGSPLAEAHSSGRC